MAKSIVSQGKYTLLSKLSTPVFAFLLLVLLGHQSDLLLGQYALVMTYYFVLQVVPLFGLTPFVMREVAKAPRMAGQYFVNIGIISVLGCVIAYLLMQPVLSWLNYSADVENSIQIVLLAIFPGILVFVGEIILISINQAKKAAIIVLIENCLRLIISVLVLAMDGSISDLFWVLLFSKLMSFILFLYCFINLKLLQSNAQFDMPFIKHVFNVMPVFFLNTILFLVVGRLDFFVLSFYQQVEVVGYYAIAYRVLEICMVAVNAIVMVIYPKLSKILQKRPALFPSACRVMAIYFVLFTALLSIFGIAFSNEYVKWFFPKQYDEPVWLSVLFSMLLVLYAVDHLLSGLLNVSNQQKADLKAMAIGSVVFTICLLLLVPKYDMYGAFLSCLVAPIVQLFFKLFFSKLIFLERKHLVKVFAYAVVITVIFFSVLLINNHVFILKLLWVALFISVLLLLLKGLGLLKVVRQIAFIASLMSQIGDEETSSKTSLAAGQMRHFSSWAEKLNQRSVVFESLFKVGLLLSIFIGNKQSHSGGLFNTIHRIVNRLLLPRLKQFDQSLVKFIDLGDSKTDFYLSVDKQHITVHGI